jgi:hypothetical protein
MFIILLPSIPMRSKNKYYWLKLKKHTGNDEKSLIMAGWVAGLFVWLILGGFHHSCLP